MRRWPRLILAAGLLGLSAAATAAENAVPSCYAVVPDLGLSAPRTTREVFVLIDQTTALDPGLAATVRDNVQRLVRPGSAFTVASFSAFERSHYASVMAAGAVEATVPPGQRAALSVRGLAKLDACLRQQAPYAQRIALRAVEQAEAGSAGSFAHSEVMASLKQLSARVAASRASDRVVIVVSDMLEHSTGTSFYRTRMLRTIDPAAELRIAVADGLIANFGGARVFVIGGGLLPPAGGADAVRDVRAINALQGFWSMYFRRSNARLVAFGTPDLVQPIG